jgi:hypothetical protein
MPVVFMNVIIDQNAFIIIMTSLLTKGKTKEINHQI